MKKILFISNVTDRMTNFSIPSIEAAQQLEYEFHMAANFSGFTDDASKYNVTLHHIDLERNPFSFRNIKAYKQMLALMKHERFDVVHCNTPIGGVLGRICGKRADVHKIIYTAHGFHFYNGAPLISRTVFKWAEMWLAHYTDVIITINEEDHQAAQNLKLRKNGRVYYIPGIGIDIAFIKNARIKKDEILSEIGANKNSILLISVGELNKNKNNKIVIKALGKLKKHEIHYILCGVGERKDSLFSLAKKYGLEKNIHFLGYRTDIPALLKSCDIFLMMSYREGLSRSLMEAMGSGLPCIVSKIRGNVDLIEDGIGGFLLGPDDVESLAEAIGMLAEDEFERRTMGLHNLRVITQFDVANVKNEMKLLYNKELQQIIASRVFT